MKRIPRCSLLVLAALAALFTTHPASAQMMYLDVNHDGVCDARDALTPATTSVDVYLVADRNADGSSSVCVQESESFAVFSYEFILRAWGDGSVAYGTWVPGAAVAEFTVDLGTRVAGSDYHTGRGGMNPLPPGRYLLGTLEITVTGRPRLSFVSSTGMSRDYITAFGSPCPGSDFDDTLKLGSDFLDACGTAPPEARPASAWDAIRRIYQ